MRFFSVIFPTWGCTGVLLKVEKNPMVYIHGTFLLFSAMRALLMCWNIGRFQRAGKVSLPQTGFSSHFSCWIIEGTIKGKGILKDRGLWTGSEECLQVIYLCNTSAKLPKTTLKASWILKGEQPLLVKFQVGFHEALGLFFPLCGFSYYLLAPFCVGALKGIIILLHTLLPESSRTF